MASLRVGVTGLSRAGKTVFLTSIIYHLLGTADSLKKSGDKVNKLRRNNVNFRGDENYSGIHGEVFPYTKHLEYFRSDNPEWPPPTEQESTFRIKLRVKKAEKKTRTIHVEFFDYPGELLADVPLTDFQYEEWCKRVKDDLDRGKDIASESYTRWQTAEKRLSSGNIGDECDDELGSVAGYYGALCRELRKKEGLILPPARPLIENTNSSKSKPWPFFPLTEETIKTRPDIVKKLRKDFETYNRNLTGPLLRQLGRCHKVVVLVDLLDILKHHHERRHNQVRKALGLVLDSFKYLGHQDPLTKGYRGVMSALGIPRVREVIFCATKADQVKKAQRKNLRLLLKKLVNKAAVGMEMNNINPDYMFCASVRTTEDSMAPYKGKTGIEIEVPVVVGVLKDSPDGKKEWVNPTNIPEEWPEHNENWRECRFSDFRPIRFPDIDGTGIPNIHLDEIIYKLLEDYL